ncbi:MAG: YncE family protein [Rudaea sp.]|nr:MULTISPECIES: YncE family protein [unclassified Rudaea]MBN8885608.1 YncE family protein [Rudaea sp.]MBR0345349.1 YncE family protein [Rudaea sp.]
MRTFPTLFCLASLLAAVSTVHAGPPAKAATPAYSLLKKYDVGGLGGWDYLLADAKSGHLFVSRGDRALVVNMADGTLAATIAGTEGIHGFALAPELGQGYTSNGRADSVTVFDLATLKPVGTIAVGGRNPDAILYDHASKHLFTFNGRSKDVSVIDPQTQKVLATIAVGGKPEFAASDENGRVYFNIEDTSELGVIDTRSNTLVAKWKLKDCEDPSGLALDAAHRRVFSVCQNRRMVVTDAASGKFVASVAIGNGPDAAAYDAERGIVFSSNGEDGSLTVVKQIDADHYTVAQTLPTETSARTLALDPESHRVYLAAAKFGAKPAATPEQPHPRAPVLEGSFKILVVGDSAAQ